MHIKLEPTERIVVMRGCPMRIWAGETDRGTALYAYVAAIAVAQAEVDDAEMVRLVEITGTPLQGNAEEFGLAEDTTFR